MLASMALAADGVVEINQTKALQGGVTPGDAPGFPVSINQAGSYRLTSNLAVPSGLDGVAISGADVSLDLGGFALEGPYACCASGGSGAGVRATGNRTRVAHGTVAGFAEDGVLLGSFSHAEGLSIRQVGGDGAELGSGSVALALRVHQVGQAGLRFTGSVRGTYGSSVLGAVAQVASSSARAVEGSARSSGGNVCSDGSCSATGAKRFYLTSAIGSGAQADALCVAGFHLMGIGETAAWSGLEYAEDLPEEYDGFSPPGPPVGNPGWVDTASAARCLGWTSNSAAEVGPALIIDATTGERSLDVARGCNFSAPAWCAED